MRSPLVRSVATLSLLAAAQAASAEVVFSNGSVITNPTGGVGITEGQPISAPESFATTGGGLSVTTAGFSVKAFAAAEDFVLPVQTDLDSVTVYAFASATAGTTNPVVTSATLNLWTSVPTTGESGILSTPLTLTPSSSTFVGWRQSAVPGSTNGTRAIYAYTFDLNELPNGGLLDAGTYWIEWRLDSTLTSANLFSPIVTPADTAFNKNARLFGPLTSGGPNEWFESWEGGGAYGPHPYALPFEVSGTFIPEPAVAGLLAPAGLLLARRRR